MLILLFFYFWDMVITPRKNADMHFRCSFVTLRTMLPQSIYHSFRLCEASGNLHSKCGLSLGSFPILARYYSVINNEDSLRERESSFKMY